MFANMNWDSIINPQPTNGIYAQYGVNGNGRYRANDLSAAITRAQYKDYEERFKPYLQRLNSMVDPANVAAEKNKWTTRIADQAAGLPGMAQAQAGRNLSRFGTQADNRAKGYGLRMGELTAASNQVGQTNQVRQDIDDRAMVLLSGQNLGGVER